MAEETSMIGLLAADREGHFAPALKLIGRLNFQGMDWHLAHVEPAFAPVGTPFLSGEEVADMMESERRDSDQFLKDQLDHLCHYNIVPSLHSMTGAAAPAIMHLADKTKADLVAIGSRHCGPVASIFLGSVGRALAIGAKQSVLIGRGKVAANGAVSAIFATDHSYYAIRALDHLIAMKPKGLRSVTLVTAYDPGELTNAAYFAELVEEAHKEGLSLKDKMKKLSEGSARKLRAAGYVADFDMKPGKVRDVLHHAMQEHRADILIIGAQGHGFFDRVMMGSVALQQVVSESHSVLVMRP